LGVGEDADVVTYHCEICRLSGEDLVRAAEDHLMAHVDLSP
jgi:hypothetical protein